MSHQSTRHQRARGFKIKHALQIAALLAICIWLLYQINHSHSHDNKKDHAKNKLREEYERSLGRKEKMGFDSEIETRTSDGNFEVDKHADEEKEEEEAINKDLEYFREIIANQYEEEDAKELETLHEELKNNEEDNNDAQVTQGDDEAKVSNINEDNEEDDTAMDQDTQVKEPQSGDEENFKLGVRDEDDRVPDSGNHEEEEGEKVEGIQHEEPLSNKEETVQVRSRDETITVEDGHEEEVQKQKDSQHEEPHINEVENDGTQVSNGGGTVYDTDPHEEEEGQKEQETQDEERPINEEEYSSIRVRSGVETVLEDHHEEEEDQKEQEVLHEKPQTSEENANFQEGSDGDETVHVEVTNEKKVSNASVDGVLLRPSGKDSDLNQSELANHVENVVPGIDESSNSSQPHKQDSKGVPEAVDSKEGNAALEAQTTDDDTGKSPPFDKSNKLEGAKTERGETLKTKQEEGETVSGKEETTAIKTISETKEHSAARGLRQVQ